MSNGTVPRAVSSDGPHLQWGCILSPLTLQVSRPPTHSSQVTSMLTMPALTTWGQVQAVCSSMSPPTPPLPPSPQVTRAWRGPRPATFTSCVVIMSCCPVSLLHVSLPCVLPGPRGARCASTPCCALVATGRTKPSALMHASPPRHYPHWLDTVHSYPHTGQPAWPHTKRAGCETLPPPSPSTGRPSVRPCPPCLT